MHRDLCAKLLLNVNVPSSTNRVVTFPHGQIDILQTLLNADPSDDSSETCTNDGDLEFTSGIVDRVIF